LQLIDQFCQKYQFERRALFWGLPTGVLFSTSYPPFPAWALFFAFAPLWIYWYRTPNLRNIFVSGFVAQFTFTFIGFNWIAHTATEYGHLPSVLSVLILVGFCLFASLNLVIAGLAAGYIKKKWPMGPTQFFFLVAILSGFADRFYPMIFPWNSGYPLLFSHLRSAQLAEFIGFNLLGTLVYCANVPFALAYMKFPKKGWSTPLIIFVVGLFIFESLGTWAQNRVPKDDSKINALLVQPNIGNYDKFVAERGYGYQEPVVRKVLELTQSGLDQAKVKPDFIILPETAYPASLDPYFANVFYVKTLTDFISKAGVPLLAGAYSDDPPSSNEKKSYNGIFQIDPGQPLKPGYRKHLLLAFGEYFPGADYFPFLKKLIPEISDFGRGIGPYKFQIGGAELVPLICYEGLDTSYVHDSLKLGGKILLNVTNDSWFGKNFEPYQHMIMTVARTIEYRMPMIRVTNTGITAVANNKGEILLRGPQDVPWTAVAQVPYLNKPPQTIFYYIEPYVVFIFLGLLFLVLTSRRKFW